MDGRTNAREGKKKARGRKVSDGGVRRRLRGVLVATSMSMLEEECGILKSRT